MGHDLELFVYPERISSELICPICTQVLKNPVQTPSEHLFCEEELLEWMSHSTLCPVTQSELDPASIKRPGRIIMNMLGELEMYCPNRCNGCCWVGTMDTLKAHIGSCSFISQEELRNEVAKKNDQINQLVDRVVQLEQENRRITDENEYLAGKVESCEKKLRVYDAFLTTEPGRTGKVDGAIDIPSDASDVKAGRAGQGVAVTVTGEDLGTRSSDVDYLIRLRQLNLHPQQNTYSVADCSGGGGGDGRYQQYDAQKTLSTQSIGKVYCDNKAAVGSGFADGGADHNCRSDRSTTTTHGNTSSKGASFCSQVQHQRHSSRK